MFVFGTLDYLAPKLVTLHSKTRYEELFDFTLFIIVFLLFTYF